jgi:hypothetical protein
MFVWKYLLRRVDGRQPLLMPLGAKMEGFAYGFRLIADRRLGPGNSSYTPRGH